MERHSVLSTDELPVGDRELVDVDGVEVGVFNVDGDYVAYLNECPNQGGPVCEGQVGGTMVTTRDPETGEETVQWTKEGRILSCPWCSWEFDLTTGECESYESASLVGYDVSVEESELLVGIR